MPPTDDLGTVLHDKATRCIALSPREQTQLQAWYTAQDQVESQLLSVTEAPRRLTTLREEIDITLRQIQAVSQRVHELMAQNEGVRSQIALLERQLAHQPTSPTA